MRDSEPLIAAVERDHEPFAPLLTLRTWFLLIALWLGTAGLWSAQMHAYIWLMQPSDSMFRWDIVRLQFAGAIYWTAASLVILALARRYRLYGRRAVPHLVIHFAGGGVDLVRVPLVPAGDWPQHGARSWTRSTSIR